MLVYLYLVYLSTNKRKKKGERRKVADALKSRTVISPFSFLLSHFIKWFYWREKRKPLK